MSKIEEMIAEMCPEGVEYKTIENIFDIRTGYTPSKQHAEYWDGEDVPWFRLEDIRKNGHVLSDSILKFSNAGLKKAGMFPAFSIICGTRGTVGTHAIITTDFMCNQSMVALIIKDEWKEKINPWFAHYLAFGLDNYMKRNVEHGKMPTAKMDKLSSYTVPVPPIEIQDAIVENLDTFTELEAELEAELEGRTKQYEYYRNLLLSFDKDETTKWFIEKFCKMHGIDFDCDRDLEWKELHVLANIKTGKKNANAKSENGTYPFFTCSEEPELIDEYSFDADAILLAGNGNFHTHRYTGRFDAYQRTYVISDFSDDTNVDYVYYYFKDSFKAYCQRLCKDGIIPYITLPMLESFTMPIPPLPVQQLIVDVLDKFSTLTEDITKGLPKELEMHRKQYGYYRNELLKFPRKEE